MKTSYNIGYLNSCLSRERPLREPGCPYEVRVRFHPGFVHDDDGTSKRRPASERARGCSLQKLDHPNSDFKATNGKPRLA